MGAAAKRMQAEASSGMLHMDGQGNYFTDFMGKLIPRGSFAKGGAALGGLLGDTIAPGFAPVSAVGKYAGSKLGNKLAQLVGFGDYTVTSNTLSKVGKALDPGQSIPSFGIMGTSTQVRHREYITDILVPASPAIFTNTSFTINPGSLSTFPWLAQLAVQYQQYRMNGLVFEYRTMTSETNTGGPMGSVIMATNYDVLENPYSDKIHMENSQFAVSAKPSCSQIHTVECDVSQVANKLYYVRSTSSSGTASQDARFYDLGTFQIATLGLPGTTGQVLGELWASYDVSLFKPEINSDPLLSQRVVAGGAGVGPASAFGATPVFTGATIVTGSVNTLTFSISGQFLLSVFAGCTVPTTPVYTGTATVTSVNIVTPLATTTTFSQDLVCTAVAGQTIIVNTSTWATSSGYNLRISAYTNSLQ